MPTFDPKSAGCQQAVQNIERRAERQEEVKLVNSFVPNKVLDELETAQNQLIFGRRGVGKTHTLKAYLGNKSSEGRLCHYIDCTSFGSGLGADGSPQNVGIRFFGKFLAVLTDKLLDDSARTEQPIGDLHDELQNLLEQLSDLAQPSAKGETFNYVQIIDTINRLVCRLGADRLTILLDEWA